MSRSEARALASLLLLFAAALPAGAEGPFYPLRYGLEAGQSWRATHRMVRETSVAGSEERHAGSAEIRYEVAEGAEEGGLRLDARMLSQESDGQASPFDFSAVRFVADVDRRGETRGAHYRIDDVTPPDIPGLEKDPAAYRQMLRSMAEAWLDSIYWLPELPQEPVAPGDTFVVGGRGDAPGAESGMRMKVEEETAYTLRGVAGRFATFDVSVRSVVDAQSGESGIRSRRTARGEAVFDLEAGMWTRHEIAAEHEAALRGAEDGSTRATARTVTTIEMRKEAGPWPRTDTAPGERVW